MLPGEDLGELRGRIAPRFWPLGFLLLGENLGEIRGRILARFWPPGFLLPGENLGEIRSRILARFWPPRISLPGGNLAGIPAKFPPGRKIPAAKISPGSQREISAGSRQDPGPYFTRVIKLQLRLKIFLEKGSSKLLEQILKFGPFWSRDR